MSQPSLPFAESPTLPPEPPCRFGHQRWDGPHHCATCAAEVERADAAFVADVAAGRYNDRGYTPREWSRAECKRGEQERGARRTRRASATQNRYGMSG